MTITKRIRFEILRRDEHTCQYCGAKAPDVVLHIDHVIPIALGGTDKPDNLLAACIDCNSGKTSIQPDSPLVERVSDHAAAYALGMLHRTTQLRADLEREQQWANDFLKQWNVWSYDGRDGQRKYIELPAGWQDSVVRWRAMGVPPLLFEKAIRIAMEKHNQVRTVPEFRYMAGVIWNTINALEIDYDLTPEHAIAHTAEDLRIQVVAAYDRGYDAGWHDGGNGREMFIETQDFLRLHVDGQHNHWAMQEMRNAVHGT